MPKTTNDSDKYVVRLPDGMRDQLKNEAKRNNRTLNAEIVERLEASFQGKQASLDDLINEPSFKNIPQEKLGDILIQLGSLMVEYADFNDTAKKGGA